ncbi:uncharacterized protein F5147DRAFT_742053 [Suillus discolor]|uniref:Uncharacterized protein n=1 Tax=Suillus discolor TaxID=1912936 RepID=A0A9P7K0G3_9AGAM|nr:uncharacterized protein F5147DRAFT_742053 [Suillus discolor]KAG2119719.1 hypothetical protein F5147DRAFT_742053 [Suillus discolor]
MQYTQDGFHGVRKVNNCILPCSPISPVVGITIEALEIYCVAHLRCLSIQAFVKTMCDLHGFSIVCDLYLQIRQSIEAIVMESISCNSPDWRLRHSCPTCTYMLINEEDLTFAMLYAMDGNDSLKRVLQRSLDDKDDTLGASSEVPTGQLLTSSRYLSCNFVDKFSQDLASILSDKNAPADDSCEGRDKTGIFVAIRRHGFCLLIVDMVQSGELAKYPLVVVSKLLDMFGGNLGGGCDISSLGPLAHSLHYTCLVGAFHRHAYRHLCQLVSLTTYIKGLGIEDLETCERTFSKSNSLASSLRYASLFHHQQAIDLYFEHNDDFKVYTNLLNFLYSNYRQALDMEEEKVYLKGLTRESDEETFQMEYWQKLVNLSCNSQALHHDATAASYDMQRVGRLVANRKYQHMLNCLEGLIVMCIFELTKINRAGTGYKLRKHIAKALQTHSAAIKSTLSTYNTVASTMSPPQKTLKWEEIVDYTFLADFDLLCNTCADISQSPWSSPVAHSVMDLHFKICCAQEEISRLNVKIHRLMTYIQDEDNYLQVSKEQLRATSPALTH